MRDTFSKPSKALFSSVETTYVADSETGEIVATSEKVRQVTRQDAAAQLNFTKMFYRDLARLYGLSKSSLVLFLEMSALIKDDKNQVIMTPIHRAEIIQRTGLSKQTIYNATRELIEAGLLVRVVVGVYMIDPHIFAVGTDPSVLANRKRYSDIQRISMRLDYTESGRSISVSAE